MKPVLIIDNLEEEAMSVKIHCGIGGPFLDVIRRLVEESQAQLAVMRVFFDRLRRACEALNYVVIITGAFTEVYPAAQLASLAASRLYELCQKQHACHMAASDLMEDVAAFLPFAEIPPDGLKFRITAQITRQMLLLFERICSTMTRYSGGNVLGGLLTDQIDEIHSLRTELKRMKEAFSWCLTTEIWRTSLKIEANTENLLLRHLRPVAEAYYNKEKICFSGSRIDTLEMIESWTVSESSPKIFWLHGPKGFGKTTISHSVAKSLQEQSRLAGCFFANRRSKECQDPGKVIPTIAYQLAKWHGDYNANVLDILRGHEELNLYSGIADQLDILIKRPIEEMSMRSPPMHKPLIIVLDGLDEFVIPKNSRQSLAKYIVDMAMVAPWLKVFVSSRWLEDIDACLRRTKLQKLDISDRSLDLRHDITAHAKICAEYHGSFAVQKSGLEDDIRGHFLRLSASLTSEIENADAFDSETGFWRIDEMFHAIAGRIKDSELKDLFPVIRHVLAIMICVTHTRPPTEAILLNFLQLFTEDITKDIVHAVVKSLFPILLRDKQDILHVLFPTDALSAFISDRHRSGSFWADIPSMRRRLAHHCLNSVHSQVKFNICGLESSVLSNEAIPDLKSRIRSCISEMVHYCSLTWLDLITQTGLVDAFSDSVTSLLCSSKALFWIEVLSLVGALEVGKDILSGCATYFKSKGEINCAATEWSKFISDFKAVMELSTLHLYISAMFWTPSDSYTASRTFSSFPPRQAVIFKRPAKLDSQMNSWYNPEDKMPAIAFSPDKKRIVSGRHATIIIWDKRTGGRVNGPLMGHTGNVYDVEYSLDGNRIFSGSHDGMVRSWDARSGKQIGEPMKCLSNSPMWALACSPDGRRIASGHHNGRVRIWDLEKDSPIAEPSIRHESPIHSIAYSPDGSRIVSGSWDETLRIWDAESGVSIAEPLKGHESLVLCVAYSPDGTRIVSGSADKTVRIWDAIKLTQVNQPLIGHEDAARDVGYSEDGSRILSGAKDGTIRMWDAKTGVPIGVVPRDDSRWDPEKQCFVSIPTWWPKHTAPRIKSLVYSASPEAIPRDGWLRTVGGDLFLWIPPEHRDCSCRWISDGKNSEDGRNELVLESSWEKLWSVKDWEKMMSGDGRTS